LVDSFPFTDTVRLVVKPATDLTLGITDVEDAEDAMSVAVEDIA
jgi:hypothetical protein